MIVNYVVCNNQIVVSFVIINTIHKRRHLNIKRSTIRYLIKNWYLNLEYVKSKDNLADPLANGLVNQKLYVYQGDETEALN